LLLHLPCLKESVRRSIFWDAWVYPWVAENEWSNSEPLERVVFQDASYVIVKKGTYKRLGYLKALRHIIACDTCVEINRDRLWWEEKLGIAQDYQALWMELMTNPFIANETSSQMAQTGYRDGLHNNVHDPCLPCRGVQAHGQV
jgi:hypothetical protein